jgi:hypothetical protein
MLQLEGNVDAYEIERNEMLTYNIIIESELVKMVMDEWKRYVKHKHIENYIAVTPNCYG